MLRQIACLLAAPALLLAGCAAPLAASAPSATTAPSFEQGMVSAADPRAAEAGAEMLRAGGSAADAALATLLTLTVVEPQSSGIGGGGFMVADDGSGHVTTIDGRETAPMAANHHWFYRDGQPLSQREAVPGGLSVGVPGNLRLMAEAHERLGRLPWRSLFAPAIRLARDGFAVTPRLHRALAQPWARDTAALTAEGRALYFAADGSPLPVGTVIRNPALARFLEQLASRGPDSFYVGPNAQAVAAAVSTAPRNPAAMTAGDLAVYEARERPPVCGAYRGWRLCGMGPPSSGATTVLGVLGMLERFDLAALGKDSPVAWHLIVEAQRLAYADRERYLADADFVSVPVAGLVAREYLAARAELIAADRTMAQAPAGEPAGAPSALADTLTPDVPSTSHFVAVDRHGQAVSLTSTIEGPFGSGLMVNGYFLNNELTDFSIVPRRDGRMVANRVEGGKRPRSSMSPTLVYDPQGRLRLAVGAAGGATIPVQVIKAIVGVIDWGLSAQDAIALPLVFSTGGDVVLVEQGTAAEAMIPALAALGHAAIRPVTPPLKANAIEVVDGRLVGGADPRSEGRAVSE